MRSTRLLIVAIALTAAGCYSQLTGNHGKFKFGYPASVDVVDFNKPIASGARLDLYAHELGSNEGLTIVSATSSQPTVLRIAKVGPNHIVLSADSAGSAEITIETESGLKDSVHMHVASPTHVQLQHSCTDEPFAAYPANADIAIPFGMSRGEGQAVIGYQHWPIRVKPEFRLALDAKSRDQGALRFRSGSPLNGVSIRSTIDDTFLKLALVEVREIDGMHATFEPPRLAELEEALVDFTPTVSGAPLCQAAVRTRARSLTPEICSASGRLADDDVGDENRDAMARVQALSYGVCEFEVSFPEAVDGAGLSRRFKLPVGKFPSVGPDSTNQDWKPTLPLWLAPFLALLAPLCFLPLLRRKR